MKWIISQYIIFIPKIQCFYVITEFIISIWLNFDFYCEYKNIYVVEFIFFFGTYIFCYFTIFFLNILFYLLHFLFVYTNIYHKKFLLFAIKNF